MIVRTKEPRAVLAERLVMKMNETPNHLVLCVGKQATVQPAIRDAILRLHLDRVFVDLCDNILHPNGSRVKFATPAWVSRNQVGFWSRYGTIWLEHVEAVSQKTRLRLYSATDGELWVGEQEEA